MGIPSHRVDQERIDTTLQGFNLELHSTEPDASIVLPAKSDSDFMLCLQSYQGLIIDRLLEY